MAHNIKQEDVIVIDDDDSMTGSAKDADADLKQEEVMHKGSSLLPVPQSQIPERVIFRPGCKVVCVDCQQGTAPQVSYGTVQSVLVDLSSMVYQFKINPVTGATFTAREDTLQFGQGEAVWVNASDGDGYVEGLVLSSSVTPGEERLYTISRPSQPGIYDAIPAKHVKYRSPGSTKPANDADEGTLKNGISISSNERLTNSNDASVKHSQNQGVSRSVVGAGSITTQEAAGRPKRALDESSASEEPRKAGKEEKEYGKPYSDKARSPRKQRREELAPRQLKKVIRIPPCVHYDHVNDELEKGDMLEWVAELNSRIHVDFNRERQNRLVLTLKGTDHALRKLTQTIKQIVAKCCEQGDKVRAIHELAVANKYCEYMHGKNNEGPVMVSVLESPHSNKQEYVGIFILPQNRDLVAMLIGKHRSGIIQIEEKSRCKVESVQEKTKRSHLCVVGNHPRDVAQGLRFLQVRLDRQVANKGDDGTNQQRSRRRHPSRGRAHAPDFSEDALL